MGHLIPAGTGFHQHRDTQIEFTVEEPEPIQPEVEEDDLIDGEAPASTEELPPIQPTVDQGGDDTPPSTDEEVSA